MVLIALIARDGFDDMMDGFVYGALVGLGFAVVEDVIYFMAVFGGTPAGRPRGVLGARLRDRPLRPRALHLARRDGRRLRRHAAAATRRAGAGCRRGRVLRRWRVAGHVLWNSPLLDLFPAEPIDGGEWLLVPVPPAVKGLPLLVFVVFAVGLAHGREGVGSTRRSRPRSGAEGLTAEELPVLRSTRAARGPRGGRCVAAPGPAPRGLLRGCSASR